MKPFATYQYVDGNPMTKRDEVEVGSKFWNEGKFDTFVEPFLPADCKERVFVDMGCNAGIFLKKAEDRGFETVIGIDSDSEAVQRALGYRKLNGGKYHIIQREMERVIDGLPMADVTVLANAHYYFLIGDWLEYLDKLRLKTKYCIIVTAQKRAQVSMAASDVKGVQSYFAQDWEQVGEVLEPSLTDDPHPRRLWGLCFKSKHIDRVLIDSLDNGNHVQDDFYRELDEGKPYTDTKYYRIIRKYRLEDRKDWTEDKLHEFFKGKVDLYNSVKQYGLLSPIVVNPTGRVLDGSHKCRMWEHLGHKFVYVRRVI